MARSTRVVILVFSCREVHMHNKRIKVAHYGHPTRNGEAPLLAAQRRR
jgi:hypothetical protein